MKIDHNIPPPSRCNKTDVISVLKVGDSIHFEHKNFQNLSGYYKKARTLQIKVMAKQDEFGIRLWRIE